MDDIAGYEPEKKELLGIADSFNKYQEYKDKGLDVPHGLLLVGEPGTGKTLFAKVLANEAHVKFYEFKSNISNFQSGAIKLRYIYRKALRHAPAIIFIDEIDRYISNGIETSDSSNRFLVTLLTLIDGFASSKGVMFIGATCDEEEIPASLMRSGRMDEKISFGLPSRKDRSLIISHYLQEVLFKKNVQVDLLAFKTVGFSGADLKNMVFMSARKAKADKKEELCTQDFYSSIKSILANDISRSYIEEDREKIAVHEIGHLLCSKILLEYTNDIAIDTNSESFGDNLYSDLKEGLYDEDGDDDDDIPVAMKTGDFYLLLITALLGGRAANEIVYSTTFPDDALDVIRCKEMARSLCYCGYFGFDCLNFSTQNDSPSNETKKRLEDMIITVLNDSYKKAKQTIQDNLSLFNELKEALMDRTYLAKEESNAIFNKYVVDDM